MFDKRESLQAFIDMKFGMFIHFGLYTLGETHEWHMRNRRMKKEKYSEEFIPKFNPDPKGMEQWVITAKEMGAKYLTVTSKHHDGFCLWDSEILHPIMPDYHIQSTPFYKNNQTGVIEKLYEAVEKYDMKLGLYYSTIDWSFNKTPRLFIPKDPEILSTYVKYSHAQCHELKKKFPEIFYIWFDGYQFKPDCPEKLKQKKLYMSLSREFPGFLVSSNPGTREDFIQYKGVTDIVIIESASHENKVKHIDFPEEVDKLFYSEISFNLNRHWGYNAKDKDYKNPKYIANIVKEMNSHNINVLLNFGPHWNGFILDEQVEIAREIGKLIIE